MQEQWTKWPFQSSKKSAGRSNERWSWWSSRRPSKDALAETRRQLQAALLDGDRRGARRLLGGHEVVLGPAQPVDVTQAKRDAAREPCIYLNGVRFCGPEGIFLETLDRVVRHMGGTRRVQELILGRVARTSAGADSYFVLQHLLGLDETDRSDDCRYVVIPRHEGRFDQDSTFSDDDERDGTPSRPTRALDVALRRTSNEHVHARVVSRNGYSLLRFDDDDAEEASDVAGSSSPTSRAEWLAIFTIVDEDLLFALDAEAPTSESRVLSISVDPAYRPRRESRGLRQGRSAKRDAVLRRADVVA